MTDLSVCYYNRGTNHTARLLASIHSLRKHNSTIRAFIFNAGDDNGIVRRICKDRRLDIVEIPIPFHNYSKNSCYIAKSSLWRHSPTDQVLFLDADTLVLGDIGPAGWQWRWGSLLPTIALTQFSDWTTHTKIISDRYSKWGAIDCPPVNMHFAITRSTAEPLPAVNTGVMLWHRESPVLELWEALTREGRKQFIPDEIAMQLLLPGYEAEIAVFSDRHNFSPIYGRNDAPVILHGHGGKHVRPEAWPYWREVFADCWREDIAGCRSWLPAGDEKLAAKMADITS